tara:strand:+ start:161 stop:724 length:564 start_codon:yes stop_codon:yes gene_type:complete
MGMGEPLDNYDNVRKALFIMNHAKGLGVGARRITISTSGITPAIRKLKSLNIQVNLAISLHASDGAKRDRLMPVNKVYPLRKLISACEEDIKTTHRKITLEYVLIKDENDSLKDANGLLAIAKRLKATVNLIPYSPVQGMHFQAPSNKEMSLFKNHLIKNRVNVTMRESKGKDIQAACGQLGKSKRT